MPTPPDAVVKLDRSPDPRLHVEGDMLAYLAEHSDLPVPRLLHAGPRLLAMEFIPNGPPSPGNDIHAADCLAALHARSAPDGRFGFHADTLIGGLRQPNDPAPSWLGFFRDRRLLHMAREARRVRRLPEPTLARIETLAERLDRWIDDDASTPSLIHGDVWGGNVLHVEPGATVGGKPTRPDEASEKHGGDGGGGGVAFIDPAIYHAEPEIELAFTTLFSTFSDAFYSRYAEHRPIAEGFFEQRRDLYNLYPLLVHVRLFGGSYLTSVENTLRRFGV